MLLVAALAAGVTYPLAWLPDLPAPAAIAWKGAGVGLLAVWASRQGRSTDHRLLAVVLLLGAAADMLLEVAFVAGAALFALGHAVAITLYLRNRRPGLARRDRVAGLALLAVAVVASVALVPSGWKPAVAVYALFLGAMAAAAGLSRFRLAFAGALLFLLSDLLIFARMGAAAGTAGLDHAIWWLYFGGQALIALGVARRLDFRAASA